MKVTVSHTSLPYTDLRCGPILVLYMGSKVNFHTWKWGKVNVGSCQMGFYVEFIFDVVAEEVL